MARTLTSDCASAPAAANFTTRSTCSVLSAWPARKITVSGLDLLSIILDADLNPGLPAELPAVMKAARSGNYQPLVRAASLSLNLSVALLLR